MSFKGKKWGFTIIELLTVMSIIVILISLLVPSLNTVRRYSRVVRQKGQFHDIGMGLEMFSIDFDGYPSSRDNWLDGGAPAAYCGAMKLCEAMMGQDGLGFHPDSVFKRDGTDNSTTPIDLYPSPVTIENRRQRKNTYVDPDKHIMCAVEDLYDSGGTSPYDPCSSVLCDVFMKFKALVPGKQISGKRIGMPVLYYKADVTKIDHDETVALGKNIYDYRDNDGLTKLQVVGITELHPLNSASTFVDGSGNTRTGVWVFYNNTLNKKISTTLKPCNENTFILISAGWDGLYGTKDDVYNFAE